MTEEKEEEKEEDKKEDKLPAKKEDKKTLIQEAKDAAAELRKGNEERAKLIEKEEKILERNEALAALGGDSLAGKKEQKDEEATPENLKKELDEAGW